MYKWVPHTVAVKWSCVVISKSKYVGFIIKGQNWQSLHWADITLLVQYFISCISHPLVSFASTLRWWLPWLRRELWIPALWGSAHGHADERAWRTKLRAGLRAPSASPRRVRCPCWLSGGHGVRTRPRQDERRPCLQYLLSLWQRRAGMSYFLWWRSCSSWALYYYTSLLFIKSPDIKQGSELLISKWLQKMLH